jgi:hypothetical protein
MGDWISCLGWSQPCDGWGECGALLRAREPEEDRRSQEGRYDYASRRMSRRMSWAGYGSSSLGRHSILVSRQFRPIAQQWSSSCPRELASRRRCCSILGASTPSEHIHPARIRKDEVFATRRRHRCRLAGGVRLRSKLGQLRRGSCAGAEEGSSSPHRRSPMRDGRAARTTASTAWHDEAVAGGVVRWGTAPARPGLEREGAPWPGRNTIRRACAGEVL